MSDGARITWHNVRLSCECACQPACTKCIFKRRSVFFVYSLFFLRISFTETTEKKATRRMIFQCHSESNKLFDQIQVVWKVARDRPRILAPLFTERWLFKVDRIKSVGFFMYLSRLTHNFWRDFDQSFVILIRNARKSCLNRHSTVAKNIDVHAWNRHPEMESNFEYWIG